MKVRALVVAAALAAAACSSSTDGTGSQAEPPAQDASQPAQSPAQSPARSAPQPTAQPTDPGAAAKTNPCTLVTKAEADAIAGTTLMPAARAEGLCTFATPTSGSTAQLEVYVGDGAKKFYDIDKISLGHPFKDVPNVGDEAHLEDGAIFVATHNTWFGLRLLRLDSTDTGPALIELARTAAGRF
jgi:hypothetical protein